MYLLVLPMTFFGSLGAFFFKKASGQAPTIWNLLLCPYTYLGGVCYLAGALLNIFLLRYLEYSIVYPMTAVTYIWTAILSYVILKEKMTRKKLGGIALICIGVVFLAL